MSETPIDTTRLRALLDERVAARATLTKAESALESATKTAITAGDLEAVAQAGGHHHRGMLERTTTYMAYQTAWTDRLNAEVNLGHAVRRQSEQLTEATVRALLDEVERLRALFTDAGQGEHDVLALIDYYQDQALEAGKAPVPRPIDEWHEDYGSVLWWTLPVCEPPYAGAPGWSDWLGYHTHWTPIVCPREPEEGGTR